MNKTPLTLAIPDDVAFSALKLSRDSTTGDISFDWAPIERICAHNNISPGLFRDAPEDNVSSLVAALYRGHLAHGGARDPVMDDLITEAEIEDAHGAGGHSHAPGRA